jgi:hypothetical protein
MYLNVASFLASCYEGAPAGSSRTACIALPLCSRAARGPGTQIIGRTSDEVDVLSTNDRQLSLCQSTRGYNCRVVWWGCGLGQGCPATFCRPSSRIRCHGSTWSRSVFARVSPGCCIGVRHSKMGVSRCVTAQQRSSRALPVMRRIRSHRVCSSKCWRSAGRAGSVAGDLFPVTTAEVRRCQLAHRQASVVRVMFGGRARSETRWECSPIRKVRQATWQIRKPSTT